MQNHPNCFNIGPFNISSTQARLFYSIGAPDPFLRSNRFDWNSKWRSTYIDPSRKTIRYFKRCNFGKMYPMMVKGMQGTGAI